jgi:hypothetical protein
MGNLVEGRHLAGRITLLSIQERQVVRIELWSWLKTVFIRKMPTTAPVNFPWKQKHYEEVSHRTRS